MIKFFFILLVFFATLSANDKVQNNKYRIISLDNSGTEILFKLNLGKFIIGKNSTCSFPSEVSEIPSVGDHNQLNLEAILNLKPTHLVVNDHISPIQMKQIDSLSNIMLIKISSKSTLDVIDEKIIDIAKAFSIEADGVALSKIIQSEIDSVVKKAKQLKSAAPTFLCVYMRGVDSLFMLSDDSGSVGLCKMIGGVPCYQNVKTTTPLNSEAFAKANPDVFVVFTSGLSSVGGIEGFLKIPGVSLTKAGKNKRIIAIDGSLISNFGPRTGLAASKLFDAFHFSEGFVEVK